jgi:hypothetical protein
VKAHKNRIVILGRARMQCASKAGNPAQNAPKAHYCVFDKSYAGSPNALAGAHTFEDDEI